MSTKSTKAQDYNGRLVLSYLLYEIRCADAKCVWYKLATLEWFHIGGADLLG